MVKDKKKSILKGQKVKSRKNPSGIRIFHIIPSFLMVFIKILVGIISLCVVSALFLGAYDFMINARYFKLDSIVIKGADERLKQEIIEIAGLRDNISLVALDVKRLKAKIIVHPWIKNVVISKNYPHELIIKVEKHQPVAMLYQEGLYYIDKDGEIFKEVSPDEDLDLPLITGISKERAIKFQQIKKALNVIDVLNFQMPPLSVENLSEINIKQGNTVVLFFRTLNAPIRANADELEYKMEELLKLLTYLKENDLLERVKMIDLDYPDSAVVSFKDDKDNQLTKQEHI